MSIRRAYADRDTWITERSLTSNFGAAPILEVWNKFFIVESRKMFARALVKYNLSALTADITAGNLVDPRTDSTVTAYLYMFNAKHGDEQAQSFNINVHPLTQEWDEGTGLDNDNYSQTGYANAVSAQSTVVWTTTGGEFVVDSSSATQAFDHGEEDLKVNITSMFNEWLRGNTGNFGVILKMTDTQELKTGASTSAQSFYKKMFYGRETNTRNSSYIQLEWPGSIKDDRNNIPFNATGQLYFYNIINGQFQDLNGTDDFPGNITLSGLTSSTETQAGTAIHTALTAVRQFKGIYKCNIGTLPLSAGTSYTALKDNWFISASPTANYLFSFQGSSAEGAFSEYKTSKYRITFRNLERTYEKGAKVRPLLFIKDDALVFTALTAATTAVSNFICTDGTWEIREVQTDLVEIPASQLSYDTRGNFFEFDTNNLYTGIDYHVVLKLTIRGETIVIQDPEKYAFRVV